MTDRRTLYVTNLSNNASRTSIWNAFIIFGQISDTRLSESNRTCLVEFEEEGDAAAALDNMHLSELFGQTIFVSYATKSNLIDKRRPIWDLEFNSAFNRK